MHRGIFFTICVICFFVSHVFAADDKNKEQSNADEVLVIADLQKNLTDVYFIRSMYHHHWGLAKQNVWNVTRSKKLGYTQHMTRGQNLKGLCKWARTIETWNQDLTDTFKIEGSDQGIQKVNLKCGSNSMNVMLETEKPFTGVMYTRGSFYKQSAPCFVKPTTQNARSLEMNFQLDQCQTSKDGELYSNIVVIQNDPELITPGDSAFSLECDFRQPRSLDVEANMQTRDRIVRSSKITLTSPDPSTTANDFSNSVQSDTDTVEYLPKRHNTNEIQKDISQNKNGSDTIRLGTVEEVIYTLEKDEL